MANKEKKELMGQMIIDFAKSYKEDPQILANLYEFSSKFYQYSLRNLMLIYSQNPDATYVGSFKFWKDQGYSVKKGKGTGLAIYVPTKVTCVELPDPVNPEEMILQNLSQIVDKKIREDIRLGKYRRYETLKYKIGYVFDISDTTCPVEDYPKYYHMGYENEEYARICKGFEQFLKDKADTDVFYEDLESISLRGRNYVGKHLIKVNDRLNDTERLSTLIHEGSHQLMHQEIKGEKNIAEIEFEADSLSIMLQSRYDLAITDSRKRHLSQAYKDMIKIYEQMDSGDIPSDLFVDQKIFNAINNSLSAYVLYKDIIDDYVDVHLNKDKEISFSALKPVKSKKKDMEL